MLRIKFLDRFNAWYDSIPEPRRFCTFIVPMTLIVVLTAFPATALFGFSLLAIMCVIAVYRAFIIHSRELK